MTATVDRTAARKANRRAAHARTRTGTAGEHLSRADRVAAGKEARRFTPLQSHADFVPGTSRDPIGLLVGQARSRVPELVPIRHGRMLVSPFTFYRGAALPMAEDLAGTPVSGLRAQLCGDAHLANFGAFGSPSRRLVFDLNDFDETLPGPFEWDIKRLAASFSVAGRQNGFPTKARRKIAVAVAESYRVALRRFAGQRWLDVWYAHLDVEQALPDFTAGLKTKRIKMLDAMLAGVRSHDSLQALAKLTTVVDGQRQIISNPPTVVPVEELVGDRRADEVYQLIREVLAKYRRTLQSDRRQLLERFTLEKVAHKVVGVGSVGTRAWILLLDGGDGDDPLFLQAKEAQASVLAGYCGRSAYSNQGERVVAGQHLMQAESDIFLGWTHAGGADGADRDFYVRQLRDWKFSAPIEMMRPAGMDAYARMCGWTLARAHARSGDRVAIGAYLGGSDKFDQAIAAFAETYADQNERDYAAFQDAARHNRIEAVHGV
jgi:uncharacterized protein (DUF2252 family)